MRRGQVAFSEEAGRLKGASAKSAGQAERAQTRVDGGENQSTRARGRVAGGSGTRRNVWGQAEMGWCWRRTSAAEVSLSLRFRRPTWLAALALSCDAPVVCSDQSAAGASFQRFYSSAPPQNCWC